MHQTFFQCSNKKNKNKKEEELDYTTTTLMQFKMQDLKKKNVFILKSKNLKKNLQYGEATWSNHDV